MFAVFRSPFLIMAFGGVTVCAVIDAINGNALLKKHFVKAGLL
jgi:hypothetical protein